MVCYPILIVVSIMWHPRKRERLAGINFTTEDHHSAANASLNNRAVLGVIVHNLVLSIFNIVP